MTFLLRPFLVLLLAVIIVAQVPPELRPDWVLQQSRINKLNQAVCYTKPEYGNCKGQRRLWFFNAHRAKCERFSYSNCGGNRNRFHSQAECDEFCTLNRKYWRTAESKQTIVETKPTEKSN